MRIEMGKARLKLDVLMKLTHDFDIHEPNDAILAEVIGILHLIIPPAEELAKTSIDPKAQALVDRLVEENRPKKGPSQACQVCGGDEPANSWPDGVDAAANIVRAEIGRGAAARSLQDIVQSLERLAENYPSRVDYPLRRTTYTDGLRDAAQLLFDLTEMHQRSDGLSALNEARAALLERAGREPNEQGRAEPLWALDKRRRGEK